MKYTIIHSPSFYIIGKSIQVNLLTYDVTSLWRSFMPLIGTVQYREDENLFSLSVYPQTYFEEFSPSKPFTKWAGVRVNTFNDNQNGLECLTVPEGRYMVFNYKGSSDGASEFFKTIYSKVIPESDYALDQRPHFELLGAKYKNNKEDSEEEIWIPVKQR